jgi:cytochrome c-type biogenesis protein CcmH/NrfF
VQSNTWLLWLGPFGLLVVGALAWWRIQRRSRAAGAPAAEAPGGAQAAVAPDLERARRLLDD